MTKTTNYQLPQWEAHDPIRRTAFNAAMGEIDGGIAAAQTTADTARNEAGAAQNTAQSAAVAAQTAQSTADTARTEAAAAQATADTAREEIAAEAAKVRFVTGQVKVEASTANGTDVITFPQGAKLGFISCYASVPLVLEPGKEGRMYVEDWSAYQTIIMTDTTFRLRDKTDTKLRYFDYAILY